MRDYLEDQEVKNTGMIALIGAGITLSLMIVTTLIEFIFS